MNRWMIFCAAFLLAGCDSDVSGWVPGMSAESGRHEDSAPPPRPAAPAPVVPVDTYCRDVAHQRMMDGKAFGYEGDMLKAIFDNAYQECEAWHVQATR